MTTQTALALARGRVEARMRQLGTRNPFRAALDLGLSRDPQGEPTPALLLVAAFGLVKPPADAAAALTPHEATGRGRGGGGAKGKCERKVRGKANDCGQ